MYYAYKKIISEGYKKLSGLSAERAELGVLVLNGLRAIEESPDLMASNVHGISPITEHFFHELATLPQSDESHWLNLVEDMAILFREYTLNNRGTEYSRDISGLLNFFETSGNWNPGDGTLVGHWFWKELPERLAADRSKKRSTSPT